MSMTDPVADMLTRIRNACTSRHRRVDMPPSKLKLEIARLLKDNHYIQEFQVLDDGRHGLLRPFQPRRHGPGQLPAPGAVHRRREHGHRVRVRRRLPVRVADLRDDQRAAATRLQDLPLRNTERFSTSG